MGTADVYRALWRHKAFIILLTAGLVAAAWFLTSRQEQVYESGTLIRIQQKVENPTQVLSGLETTERSAETYAQIAGTEAIATRIAKQLRGRVTLNQISVSAEPVQDLELLWVLARSTNPRTAQLVANAAPPALQAFIRETGTLRDQVVTIESAGLPSEPASPNLTMNLALAFLLGIIFNGALALLIEVLGDPLPDPDQLEQQTGHAVLATIPALRFSDSSVVGLPQSRRPTTEPEGVLRG